MVFFCYRCHKTIYNVSPAYHNLSCKVPFRNRNNHNNNSIIRNRFNHRRFNNAHNHRSNRYNNLDSWNNESINRFNINIERIRLNNNDNNNSTTIEIPDAFLQNRNDVLINNIIRRNNERDNDVSDSNNNKKKKITFSLENNVLSLYNSKIPISLKSKKKNVFVPGTSNKQSILKK